MDRARTETGFTLLEVLVSISLTAVVLTILLGGFRLTEEAQRRGEEKLDAMAQRLAAMDALQVQMSSAVPRVSTMEGDTQHRQLLSFRGTAKEVRFLTRFSWAGERAPGLYLATYRALEEPGGHEQLVISEVGITNDYQFLTALLAQDAPSTYTMPVGNQADDIEFSYLQPSSPAEPATWFPEWKTDEKKEYPKAVQVHFLRAGQEQLVTLVISVEEEAK
jgi:prepilin-type N-terminal cleavage/methylation domain-containing protein